MTIIDLAAAFAGCAWLLMSLAYLPALRFYPAGWFWAPLLPAIASFYLGGTFDSAIRLLSRPMERSGTGCARHAASRLILNVVSIFRIASTAPREGAVILWLLIKRKGKL